MPIDSVLHTNRHSIDRLLNAGLPVALIFWDQNNAPVKANEEALDRLAAKYAGRALIARIDANEEGELIDRYQIDSVPSFAFVNNGDVIERTQVDDPDYIDAWLAHLVEGDAKPARRTNGNTANQEYGAGRTQATSGGSNARSSQGTGGKPVTLTDANFQNVVSGNLPVLVDFWAEWCGPCRMVAPSVEELAREFDGRAIVGKLDVENNPLTAGQYGISSIPSLLIFNNGQVVDQIVGAQPLPVLRQRLTAQVQ